MNLNIKKEKHDFTYGRRVCACCGKCIVDFFDVCDICGWENDLFQNDNPDFSGGANDMSLNEARKAYAEGKEIN